MATPKQAHALVSYFEKVYKERHGFAPTVNRYSARWGFDSILLGMSEQDVKALMDYYMKTVNPSGHSLDWFFYNYEKLIVAKREQDKDTEALKRVREASKKRAEEWRKKIGNE